MYQWGLSFFASGNAKRFSHIKDNLAVSYRKKHTLAIHSNLHIPQCLPSIAENLCTYKEMHTKVYSTLLIIAKTGKQPRCPSAGEWINYGLFRQWNIIQYEKEMNNQAMGKYGRTLNVCY